jgi:hypothetical protein
MQKDEIKCKWTPDGQYTTKSAYRIQFFGATRKTSAHPNLESASRAEMQDFCLDSPTTQDTYDQQPSQTRMAT